MRSPSAPSTAEQLRAVLSDPYPEDIAFAEALAGDVIVLGAGGKMGPTLVRRIVVAIEKAGGRNRVFAASRFSDGGTRQEVEEAGAHVLPADLLDDRDLLNLPDAPNVIFLVGMKFGSSGKQPLTWALNAYLPGRIAARYEDSRIVALSAGNVYPRVQPETGGSKENDRPEPLGEYAQSCLGRERVFEHFCLENRTPVCLIRLNYALEARYGVFLDNATKIFNRTPISLEMGYVNTI